ncbi:hypothetical protein F511_38855 [Dorcoceras hygrometricum]|uniref:Uncharacterized protein n=1 Tax=Dorcoceras hygrometricum TaxID=472368 RepID=A0A2Z7AWM7_9LAMI|nr:hypothetical protein F511_38855 [Dorcoceras hygrometricum]
MKQSTAIREELSRESIAESRLAYSAGRLCVDYSAVARTSRKIPAGSICLIPAGQPDASNSNIHSRAYLNQLLLYIQSQATVDSVASYSIQSQRSRRKKRRSSEAWQTDARSSRSDEPAAKQLTIYKSWMSTAELNSNGESDKTQSTFKMERING